MTTESPHQLSLFCRRKSYEDIQKVLNRLQRLVFECIRRNPNVTDNEIKAMTGLEINSVTARRNKLAYHNKLWEKPLIKESGTKPNPQTGKPNTTWRVNEDYIEEEENSYAKI